MFFFCCVCFFHVCLLILASGVCVCVGLVLLYLVYSVEQMRIDIRGCLNL